MLTQLSIHQLRNLQAVHIQPGQCNVFIGANGSGKTSLLESLYLLSRGKSFRHHQPKRYISHHAPHTTVFAKFANGSSMAIQKAQDASSIMRLDQQAVYVQSALTKQLPTLLIDPSSMDILEIGSGSRRQLLDWITFHVKPGFHPQWLSYQRLLKQRNALLKQSPKLSAYQLQELAAWDKGLANHAALITHYRQQAFEEWQPLFNTLIQQLLPDYAPFIQLKFSAGYNTEVALDELLQQRLAQDCQTGYTRIGCHRADVQVLWVEDETARQQVAAFEDTSSQQVGSQKIEQQDTELESLESQASESILDPDQPYQAAQDFCDAEESSLLGNVREQAANVLSRGEKKLLITALKLSQLPLLATMKQEEGFAAISEEKLMPLVLLDDISAELDERALNILLNSLSQLSCQVFITSLEPQIMAKISHYWPQAKMFHVKQGQVTEAAAN
ncbi:DNA replication/repair protein RecF [Psychrobacter phenylpyruvicus]|uniref:DNA replication and repair protein RecF n=1 Tax=Psychrobacter phenylpyruvicus TaxID=29432 RepID=A0A379LND0_9GAMM|nr:DNA replication and repair protein RecF [Psychrobacter phenylpyruvicus]SUD92099.1 DNA replication and repair protein recF [Psychrobacter phenylpyruvicus]